MEDINFGPNGTIYVTVDGCITLPLSWKPRLGEGIAIPAGDGTTYVAPVTAVGRAWTNERGPSIQWHMWY